MDADTGRTIGLAIKELRMRDPRVRGGGGLLRGNIFDAGGHEQCVPAGLAPPPLHASMFLLLDCEYGCSMPNWQKCLGSKNLMNVDDLLQSLHVIFCRL